MKKDKRYLVFLHEPHYALGGLGDMVESFDSIPEAIDFIKQDTQNDKELYDRINGVEVDLSIYGII